MSDAAKRVHSTPGRIAALAIGFPLLLAAVGQGGFNVVGLLARSSANHSASYAWHGGSITIDSGDGNVTVRRGSSATVDVSYTEHYGLKTPTVTGGASGSGVALKARCPGGLLDQYCSVNYTVLVPPDAALNLRLGDGNVTLDGVNGDVTVSSGDGRVRGTELGAQKLTASGGDGSVSLQWRAAPKRVEVSIGDGGISVEVPAGSGPYAITPQRADGHTDITVPVDPQAARSMLLRMGDGSISVH